MVATVTLYYNTGFNTKNIPDSPTLLNSMTSATFESNYELQNNFIRNCFIEATWDDVKNADYLKLSNCYYFIVSINMINENCAELLIQIDALTTLGGPNALTYSGGIVSRAHPDSDGLFENVVEEDIGPLKPIKIIDDDTFSSGSTSVTIVGATLSLARPAVTLDADGNIDVAQSDLKAFVFKGSIGQDDYTVSVPQPSPLPNESNISIDGHTAQLSGVGLYNYSVSTVQNHIRYLRMLNLDGAILYCYNLPYNFGGEQIITPVADGNIELSLSASTHTFSTSLPYVRSDYASARNKKVYAMYSTYRTSFDLSGDEQIFNACDLYHGDSSPSFAVLGDPQPSGCFIAHPAYFQGRSVAGMHNFKAVRGLPWKTTPISFNTEKGEYLSNMDNSLAKSKLKDTYWSQYGNFGGISAMLQGGMSGAPGGIAGTMTGAFIGGMSHLGQGIEQGLSGGKDYYNPLNEIDYQEAKRSLVVPDLTSAPCVGLNNVLPEKLIVQQIGPTVDDLRRFDKYFDMYGYAMAGEVFKKSFLTNRQNCNYIKASDIHIVSDSSQFGVATKTEAERQLNNGVRIWHIKPANISSNPHA